MILPGILVAWALLLLVQEGPAPTTLLPKPPDDSPGGTAQSMEGEKDRLPARLSVSVIGDQEHFELLNELSEEWEGKHPSWQVTLSQSISSDGGQDFDVRMVENSRVIPLASSGKLLPADGLVSSGNGEANESGFNSFARDLRWRGYWWGTQAFGDPVVLIWSRQLLEKAKLQHWPVDWADMQRLMGLYPERSAVTVSRQNGAEALAWLQYWHGKQASSDPALLQAALTPGVQGAAMLSVTATPAEAMEQVRQGRSLSAVVPWSYYWESADVFEADLAFVSAGGSALRNEFSFVISSDTEFSVAAGSWIAAVTSSEAQERLYRATGKLPSDPGLYTEESVTAGGSRPPTAWKKPLFQEDHAVKGFTPEQAAAFQPLWLAYWASGGGMSPQQLAVSWNEHLEG
ncbi:extracellular solute-binding protein [Paenibacillus herberti]|uniref:ABC transporter substrate-binding protein n=1 Tax=Paenibacillus herberti TaxID=1619309 RepID=A0A229P129_9BACL|nr:extracellular solute-binding protein [Paenibacillus herberti]OXM15644.1 hypothetical protein CGZ75_02620 [Paenibacillus herberti]